MLNVTEYIEENDLARKMWGKYLRNERKYDRYGAQGKIVLLQEVLLEHGYPFQEGINYRKLINEIFPRTFYCEHRREITPPLMKAIVRYYKKLDREFTAQGLPGNVVQYICVLETAEKFCLPTDTIREMITSR